MSAPTPYIYLYCFYKGQPLKSPFDKGGFRGISEGSYFVLSYECLCALVSPVPRNEYSEDALKQRLQDLEWLTPRIKRHEEIIRQVTEIYPVIPVRFGAIYENAERVLEILRCSYDRFCSHLDSISDKEEWGIKVYARKGAGEKAAEASSELVRQMEERISSATSAGQAYLLKKKRENLIRQESADLLIELSESLYQQMLSWSVEGRANKLLSKRATGREDEMVLNAAFLLDKSDVETFRKKLDALAADYGQDGLSFEISGPWPCYNFCPDFTP
jgi:endonuclease V-like protein UPF0215 family